MMQRCLTVHSFTECLQYGTSLLRLHRGLTTVDAAAYAVPRYRLLRRLSLGIQRRFYAWQIFLLRLKLRSWNAISDLLVYSLFLVVCVLLYEIYYICRIGVNRAEERYRTLAIPILQTFEALEAAQGRKQQLRTEMEKDIIRSR